MYKRRRRRNYLNDHVMAPTNMKMNRISGPVTPVTPVTPVVPRNSGISDSEGLYRAYHAPNAIYVDGNRAYVAGTREPIEAVRDWPRIGTWQTKYIPRYAQLTEALKENPQVDTLIGHSLGASTVAEMQRQTNNKYLARYYGAPFLNIKPWDAPDPRNQTFRHPGDPVSMLDNRAVDIRSNDFYDWYWPHGYFGFDQNQIPDTYSNDFDVSKYKPRLEPSISGPNPPQKE